MPDKALIVAPQWPDESRWVLYYNEFVLTSQVFPCEIGSKETREPFCYSERCLACVGDCCFEMVLHARRLVHSRRWHPRRGAVVSVNAR